MLYGLLTITDEIQFNKNKTSNCLTSKFKNEVQTKTETWSTINNYGS